MHDAMTLTEARGIIGSLGFPSKMPGTSYGLPVSACIAGARLSQIDGSICGDCYAARDFYAMTRNALLGQLRRLDGIAHPDWVEAMVRVLRATHSKPAIKIDLGAVGVRLQRATGNRKARWRYNEPGFHRWHDSGDLQSVEHLEKIIEVCRRTPQIRHWLPTRELAIVRACKAAVPDNLTIRVSATMIDGPAPRGWPVTSTVHTEASPAKAWECPARHQQHRCGACRACWSRDVPLVSYPRH